MGRLVGWNLRVDGVQKADELLMTVALHVLADDGAVEDIEGGEECRGAMALVVMGHGDQPPLLHRQAGLGAVERLNLAFLVGWQHNGMGRRIDIKGDDITQFLNELRIVGELELAHLVRLQAMRLPDAAHRASADAGGPCHGERRPMRGLARRISQRQPHDAFRYFRSKRLDVRGPRLVEQEALDALAHETLLPAPDCGLGDARFPHDRRRADAGGRQLNDPAAPDVLLRGVPVIDDSVQPRAVRGRDSDGCSCTHATDSHTQHQMGIPKRTLRSDVTHYIPMARGHLYLVAIMDWASRAVLAWRLSNTMDTRFCLEALEEALARYGKPGLFNTDHGSQFTSAAFTGALEKTGVQISMDGRGRFAGGSWTITSSSTCGARSNTKRCI
jgi:Integrase core domain